MWRGDSNQESSSVPSPADVLGKASEGPHKGSALSWFAAVAPETCLLAPVLVLLPCFQCSSQSKQFKCYFRPCTDHSTHSHSSQVLVMAGMAFQGLASLTFLLFSLLLVTFLPHFPSRCPSNRTHSTQGLHLPASWPATFFSLSLLGSLPSCLQILLTRHLLDDACPNFSRPPLPAHPPSSFLILLSLSCLCLFSVALTIF